MKVLRIELESPVCSFRYPHFLVGRQPSFDLPPPATIFGHIASALGEWPDPETVRFAYRFTALGRGDDLENQHIVVAASGSFSAGATRLPKSLDATVQPTRREILFGARLVLYLDRLDLAEAFHAPAFPVVLGRSQDLACYTRVEDVTLERADRGYFENTILPFAFRQRTSRGVTVSMPRYIAPPPLRQATFDRFIVLRERLFCLPPGEPDRFANRQLLHLDDAPLELWIDTDTPEVAGMHAIVWFDRFVAPSGSDA